MALCVDANDGPLELGAVGWPHAVIEPHPGTRTIDFRCSEYGPQRGSDENFETDEGGYRIAWQTENQRIA